MTNPRKREPDLYGGITFPSGHARPGCFDGLVLGVGVRKLPTGHNY